MGVRTSKPTHNESAASAVASPASSVSDSPLPPPGPAPRPISRSPSLNNLNGLAAVPLPAPVNSRSSHMARDARVHRSTGDLADFLMTSGSDEAPHNPQRITKPAPRPLKHHLSDLLDPYRMSENAVITSPSGNQLSREQLLARSDRPLSVRERQERVRMGTRRQISQLSQMAEVEEDLALRQGREKGVKGRLKWLVSCAQEAGRWVKRVVKRGN